MGLVEFRVISGYSMYSVGSDGSIKNNKTGRILKQTNNQGYWMISIKNDFKIRVTLQVHRIVAFAFISNPLNKPLVNHKDCLTGVWFMKMGLTILDATIQDLKSGF